MSQVTFMSGDKSGWPDLLELCRRVPSSLKNAKTKAPINLTPVFRLVLWTVAQHADGKTWQTWVSRETIMEEAQVSRCRLDDAIAALKATGILSSYQRMNDKSQFRSCMWTLHRDVLERIVGPRVDDEPLRDALDSVHRDGKCELRTAPARRHEIESRLKHLAGGMRIRIEVADEDERNVSLLIVRVDLDDTPPSADEDDDVYAVLAPVTSVSTTRNSPNVPEEPVSTSRTPVQTMNSSSASDEFHRIVVECRLVQGHEDASRDAETASILRQTGLSLVEARKSAMTVAISVSLKNLISKGDSWHDAFVNLLPEAIQLCRRFNG
jgi:hypothetical protein